MEIQRIKKFEFEFVLQLIEVFNSAKLDDQIQHILKDKFDDGKKEYDVRNSS